MNQGAKLTLGIAATLFLSAVMPLLAVAGSLILVGMALHSIMSAGNTTMPLTRQETNLLDDQAVEADLREARRALGYDYEHRN